MEARDLADARSRLPLILAQTGAPPDGARRAARRVGGERRRSSQTRHGNRSAVAPKGGATAERDVPHIAASTRGAGETEPSRALKGEKAWGGRSSTGRRLQ
ncbi:hypothetical protein GCM10029978_083130 [Actinoallomurus acanthiterrae]